MGGGLEDLVARLRAFVAERDWAQFHDPKNLTMALASEVGELCALYRWVRNEDADAFSRDAVQRPRIEAEVADVTILLLLLSDRLGIDLPEAVNRKIDANALKYPAATSRGRSEPPGPGGM